MTDDEILEDWTRRDECLHGKNSVLWFARCIERKALDSLRKPLLTDFERMQIIGDEFPLALVQPIVIQKIDSVCRAIERKVRGEAP